MKSTSPVITACSEPPARTLAEVVRFDKTKRAAFILAGISAADGQGAAIEELPANIELHKTDSAHRRPDIRIATPPAKFHLFLSMKSNTAEPVRYFTPRDL